MDIGKQHYKEIGFMCGLEIHQRLATSEKLFCSCTARLPTPEEKNNAVIKRHQKAVAGELGLVDRAAKFEEEKAREFVYEVNEDHACLVDLDEEPPHGMNGEALAIALSMASSMSMHVPEEIQPMRKQVVDGSNPSGFQRTTKIGMDGFIELGSHKVNITSMFIEEESAGIETSAPGEILYDTSRIGIPLIEIDTDPYIRSPEEAKEVALKLGMMLRLTGKVQRGIGSIRQDVNVSIKGGARVEIKGLQDLDALDKFIENEVLRQERLVAIKEELGSKKGISLGTPKEVTTILRGTKAKIISNAIGSGGIVMGFALHGFAGVLGKEVNPGRRLGSEISDYAKMGGVNGIMHSDENLEGYGLSREEIELVRKELGAGKDGAFILISGKNKPASTAIRFALDRARAAIETGVLLETRGAVNNDMYTTRFLRPLPGGSRMYPETDARPISITGEMLARAKLDAPDIDKTKKHLEKDLGSGTLVEQLLLSPRLQAYNDIVANTNADRAFVANTLLQKFTELRRSGFNVDSVSTGRMIDIFNAYVSGKITKNGVEELLKAISAKDQPVHSAIKERGIERITGAALEKLVEQAKGSGKNDKAAIITEIMSRHRLNVDGEELNKMLKQAKP